MSKPVKIIGIFAVVCILAVIAAAIGVSVYFTSDRLKAMIVPRLEKQLGRPVALDKISLNIFKGIEITGLKVAGEDKDCPEALQMDEFIFNYRLLPLIKKQFVIKKIFIHGLYIKLVRNKKGEIDLVELFKGDKDKKDTDIGKNAIKEQPESDGKSLGDDKKLFLLTADIMELKNGDIIFEDHYKRKSPVTIKVLDIKARVKDFSTDTPFDYSLALKLMSDNPWDVDAHGSFNIKDSAGDISWELSGNMEGLKPLLSEGAEPPAGDAVSGGRISIKEKKISLEDVTLSLNKSSLALNGFIDDFSGQPVVRMDITAPYLSMDDFAIPGKAKDKQENPPVSSEKTQKPDKNGKSGAVEPDPVDLKGVTGEGMISIDEFNTGKVSLKKMDIPYLIMDNTVKLESFKAFLGSGEIKGGLLLDLKKAGFKYFANIGASDVEVQDILRLFDISESSAAEGLIDLELVDISGAGVTSENLKKNLSGTILARSKNIKIIKTPLLSRIASLLKTSDILPYEVQDGSGKGEIKDGKIYINTDLKGNRAEMLLSGWVGFDKNIKLRVPLTLSPKITKKVKILKQDRYFKDERGWTQFPLIAGGTIDRPYVSIDTKAVTKKAVEKGGQELKKEVFKAIDKELPEKYKGFLKDIF